MNLLLKPLVITNNFQERVNISTKIHLDTDRNSSCSNEYFKISVVTGGQDFFINHSGLITNNLSKFSYKNRFNSLKQYSGELIIYNINKINHDFDKDEKISIDSIGSIFEIEKESKLKFIVYLNEELFLNLKSKFF